MSDLAPPSIADRLDAVELYDFRALHPRLAYGTASDRYAAWIGQVYPETWEAEVTTRAKKLGGTSFEERLLPIASVVDYFQHFGVLELDFTFYRPLVTPDGEPSPNYHVLRQYAEHAPDDALFLLKAPQQFAARVLRRKGGFVENETYLDPAGFEHQFAEPAFDLLGERLAGVIFEQEYARVRESPEPEAFVAELDRFFAEVPPLPYHLEVRSPHLLTPLYADWLSSNGLGFVFSHWTWLPSIQAQWRLVGERFTSGDGEAILRLLNPREMKYAAAFAHAYPFTDAVPALAQTAQARTMVNEATALAYKAIEQGVTLFTIANNRAWGNSPKLAQALSRRFLDFADRYGA
ncbi:MAG: DUF72 domain-containing protein [Bacteroidota bacterium]